MAVSVAMADDFEELINTPVANFVELSHDLGEPLNKMASLVKKAFEAELDFIYYGVRMSQPNHPDLMELMKPILDVINEIQDFRGKNRHVEAYFNHLSAISESISALTWVNVTPAPAQFVKDMTEAGEYYGNRVLTAHRGETNHMNWVKQYNAVLKQLEQYVRKHHITGFSWNASSRGKNPPPPPPPPAFTNPDTDAGGDSKRFALLTEINQGMGITRMLKHVKPKDDKSAAAQPNVPGGIHASVSQAAPKEYCAKFALDGRKWRVEHQKQTSLRIMPTELFETAAIYKCLGTEIEIVNKINGVSVDNCKKTTIYLSDVISSVEVIGCVNLKIVCQGHVPLISIDNSDSVEVYLSVNSRDTEIISSKSTSSNVCLLEPDGDYNEMPVPEQIKTVVVNGKLQSSLVQHM